MRGAAGSPGSRPHEGRVVGGHFDHAAVQVMQALGALADIDVVELLDEILEGNPESAVVGSHVLAEVLDLRVLIPP